MATSSTNSNSIINQNSRSVKLSDLSTLNGGAKQLWINQNRKLILDYHLQFGEAATLQQFNMKAGTLRRILEHERQGTQYASRDEIDRALLRADVTEMGVRELRHEVKELKNEYGRFTESVSSQLVEKFFYPLLQSMVRLPDDMRPPADPLALSNFSPPAKRIKAKNDT